MNLDRVENIGTNLIDDAKLIVGGEQLNKITGKLMQVLSEVKYDTYTFVL